MEDSVVDAAKLFNNPIEIGFRALVILNESHPKPLSFHRLIVLDYLLVHSDDFGEDQTGVHPKTPHRGTELLVRHDILRNGLDLYRRKGLIEIIFSPLGIMYVASASSASFLDAFSSSYSVMLKDSAEWLNRKTLNLSDESLLQFANENISNWGGEFVMESVILKEFDKWI